MDETRRQPEADAQRRHELGRRARRGLVAGYVRDLSSRHRLPNRDPELRDVAASAASIGANSAHPS